MIPISSTSGWMAGDHPGHDRTDYPRIGGFQSVGLGMTRIRLGSGSEILPVLFTGYESTQESRTIVHQILGKRSPDVTLRPAQRRTGQLEMLFDSEHNARAAESLLAGGEVCTLLGAERDSVHMWFVVVGDITRTLDDDTRDMWFVRFGFQEIDPIAGRYVTTPGTDAS